MIIPNIWENKKCSKPPTSKGLAADMSIKPLLGLKWLNSLDLGIWTTVIFEHWKHPSSFRKTNTFWHMLGVSPAVSMKVWPAWTPWLITLWSTWFGTFWSHLRLHEMFRSILRKKSWDFTDCRPMFGGLPSVYCATTNTFWLLGNHPKRIEHDTKWTSKYPSFIHLYPRINLENHMFSSLSGLL